MRLDEKGYGTCGSVSPMVLQLEVATPSAAVVWVALGEGRHQGIKFCRACGTLLRAGRRSVGGSMVAFGTTCKEEVASGEWKASSRRG